MKNIEIEDKQGNQQKVCIYNIVDFPYKLFYKSSTVETRTKKYFDLICTFDIETTTIYKDDFNVFDCDFGFMYIWQFCIEGYVVMGRTWDEFIQFLIMLRTYLDNEAIRLCIYVHNLQFEFQFMRNFFNITKVFCREERNVVYALTDNNIEFRCSYALSNMSLAKFLEKTKGVTFDKKKGDLDYRIYRYPDTELTDVELGYCVVDVLGLYQALRAYLIEDNLCTIPMTSTGYVRRDYKEKCIEVKGYQRQIRNCKLNQKTYLLCKAASRGAIAGSNYIHTDEVLENVDSHDIKSSYPFQMATKYFPSSKLLLHKCKYGSSKFEDSLQNKCCLITCAFQNIKVNHYAGIPYISKANCISGKNTRCGNGKVYEAEELVMTCTEIDFKIIRSHYQFSNVYIYEIFVAEKALLPKPFREHLMFMFQEKTNLEDGDKFLYDKYKNKINASFGMMLTDIIHEEIVYTPNDDRVWNTLPIQDIDRALSRYYNGHGIFLSYQNGVWVLAHGRDELVDGMDIVGHDLVQVDTDSVKNLGDYKQEFEEYNKAIIAKAEDYDVKPYSIKNGKKHYLGIWEHEGDSEYTYEKFKTLGAKKYAYSKSDGLDTHITVSGLRKSAGEYFDSLGGLDAFRSGIVVPPDKSGRTASLYNDWKDIKTINIHGHMVTLSSNIAVTNVPYTLGMTGEWSLLCLDGKVHKDDVLYANWHNSTVEQRMKI